MSPLQARRAVGHPDIVDRLHRLDADHCGVINAFGEGAREITRLRSVLRAVRCSTDPAWAKRMIDEALGDA